MSQTPPPYTGRPAKTPAAKTAATKAPAAKTPAAKTPATKTPAAKTPAATAPTATPVIATPAPAAPAHPTVVGYVAIWHSRAVLIVVGALAVLTIIGTAVGAANFPSAAPVEQLFAFGVIVDMVAVAIAVGVMIVVEYARHRDPNRAQLPVNTRRSVFAIVALVMAVLTVAVWTLGGGPLQLLDMSQGFRARYMYHTGGLFVAGIPWALSLIFGAWGFRPHANIVTNVLAIVSVAIGGLLAVVAIVAALVYGAGLSD